MWKRQRARKSGKQDLEVAQSFTSRNPNKFLQWRLEKIPSASFRGRGKWPFWGVPIFSAMSRCLLSWKGKEDLIGWRSQHKRAGSLQDCDQITGLQSVSLPLTSPPSTFRLTTHQWDSCTSAGNCDWKNATSQNSFKKSLRKPKYEGDKNKAGYNKQYTRTNSKQDKQKLHTKSLCTPVPLLSTLCPLSTENYKSC